MVVNRKVGNPHAGIVAYLMQRLMLGGEFKPETRQVPDTGMGRGNNRALDEIVQAVAADRDGIGYSGFANAVAGVKALALAEDAGHPFYAGTRDEVARRVYPLTRTIFVFVRRGTRRPAGPGAARVSSLPPQPAGTAGRGRRSGRLPAAARRFRAAGARPARRILSGGGRADAGQKWSVMEKIRVRSSAGFSSILLCAEAI